MGTKVLTPGATVGILGGGQLGRMTAMAARTSGFRVLVLDPDENCSASRVVDAVIAGGWNDAAAAAALAQQCDVVTLEIEQLAVESLVAAGAFAPVRPGVEVIRVIQDRALQREWLAQKGIPQTPWQAVRSLEELRQACTKLGGRIFLKSARGGYDGRGQAKLGFDGAADEDAMRAAWESLGEKPCVAEAAQELAMELSVMVARNPSGEMLTFPPA